MNTAHQLRSYADATCALRATPAQFARGFEAAKSQFASHGQAPAQAAHSSAAQTANCTYPACQIASGCGGACGRQLAQAAPAAVAGPINRIPLVDRNDPTAELLRDKHNWWELYRNGDPVRSLNRFECEFVNAALAAAPTTQPAPQQEAQEPVAWYVTGCGRLLDEYEAEAEARRIGGTAKAMPLYTVPQPSPASQEDALDAARYRWLRHGDNDEKVLKTYTSLPSKPGEPTMFLPRNEELDRLIDAARAAQKGGA